jgi:hypothetical protein
VAGAGFHHCGAVFAEYLNIHDRWTDNSRPTIDFLHKSAQFLTKTFAFL